MTDNPEITTEQTEIIEQLEVLDSRILKALIESVLELNQNGIPALMWEHKLSSVSGSEKQELLEQSRVAIAQYFESSGLKNAQNPASLRFLPAITLTGKAPKGEEFLVTTYGHNLEDIEIKRILSDVFSYEEPSNKTAKKVRLGRGSGMDLKKLGQAPGFVGPFTLPIEFKVPFTVTHRIVLQRSLFTGKTYHEAFVILVDFAIDNNTSLLIPFDHVDKLLEAYSKKMKLIPEVKLYIDNLPIFPGLDSISDSELMES